eukprot:gene5719-7114_t
MNNSFEQDTTDLLDKIKHVWINEKFSPDILNYEEDLVKQILKQIETKEELCSEINDTQNRFTAQLYEMEVERLKYLIRSYLRTRIKKIDKFYAYISQNSTIKSKLSNHELEYCEKFTNLIENHFQITFLESLPKGFTKNDHKNAIVPDLDSFIFCTPKGDLGDIEINDEETVEFKKGHIYLIRYKSIMFLLESGKMDLL